MQFFTLKSIVTNFSWKTFRRQVEPNWSSATKVMEPRRATDLKSLKRRSFEILSQNWIQTGSWVLVEFPSSKKFSPISNQKVKRFIMLRNHNHFLILCLSYWHYSFRIRGKGTTEGVSQFETSGLLSNVTTLYCMQTFPPINFFQVDGLSQINLIQVKLALFSFCI